jgi:hypothetical protein
MRRRIARIALPILIGCLTLGGGATAAVSAAGPHKPQPSPGARLADQQRVAIVAQAHARNARYLQDFAAQRRDPHSLPVIKIPSFAPLPLTMDQALSQATLVVHATVRAVTFQANPSGGLPLATATVDVLQTARGRAAPTITMLQLGGPVAEGSGGALAQLDTDPLLLPGDDVLLLLHPSPATPGLYRTVLGAGVNKITNGTVRAQEGNPFGAQITGRSVPELLAAMHG